MKHRPLFSVLSLLVCIGFTACNQADSFEYEGETGICFDAKTYQMRCGSLPYSVEEPTFALPLSLIGHGSGTDRGYTLSVVDSLTTAKEGTHYAPFAAERTLKAGQFRDTLWIKILRKNLDDGQTYRLTLRISPQSQLKAALPAQSVVSIQFDNRLDMPTWWPAVAYWLGEYNIRKYQKFIELNGSPVTAEQMEERKYEYLRIFRKVKEYFEAHPEEGVVFPNVHWEV
ncbi:DUF4843 domain-containing protein [Prevotella sp. HUN102]|uniref:DUF4843 domain-containing protein n=1 Tax=Prevotella sp. HUN102 TaxID=1392486 RepID=UPI00048DB11A|nr:DUF4843 domain-containing protein [Prevotella sp. HUN102]